MPRLQVAEPPQHGMSTGSAIKRKKAATPEPRRTRCAARTPQMVVELPAAARKRRHFLSKDSQAALALRYVTIQKATKARKQRAAAIAALCQDQ
jgi:hypothetical protein